MNFLKVLFQKRKKWIEFDTLYSIERLEQLRFFMVEKHIPYKVRAALLPVPLNTPMPSCAASCSLWHISVHPEDVHLHVQESIRQNAIQLFDEAFSA